MRECTTIEYPFELYNPAKNKSDIGYECHRILIMCTIDNTKKDGGCTCTIMLCHLKSAHIFLQLAKQHCCVATWKALLHVLPPTSNIVTQQNFVVASWSSMLHQVELASTFFNKFFQLAATNFIAWQCLRRVVIRPTTLFNATMLRSKLQQFVARITSP